MPKYRVCKKVRQVAVHTMWAEIDAESKAEAIARAHRDRELTWEVNDAEEITTEPTGQMWVLIVSAPSKTS